jgi:MYXO-CTERM domain-containing protein
MSACVKGDSQCLNGAEVCSGGAGPSVEVCDGIDNDCNGMVDDNVAAGVGQPCGANSPPCQPGTTACVAGALVCQGGVQPQAEVCDGADNDCDGAVDEIPLADAPMPGMNGCWTLPGNTCSHQNYQWSPPAGATCSGTGTLTSPCNIGTLSCDGANGWTCTNDTAPQAEVCDGIDNNCNGAIDDGNLPNVGGACGSNVGECQEGMLACNMGVLDCVGDIPPSQEICDNKDNDCDGVIDNNIASMGPCDMPYDVNVYPGNRSNSPCQKGVLECDGMGTIVCKNGQGPQPELCDGIDNDCDGNIDETGPAPDGLDLTANPLPPPAGNIGDACGESTGLCEPGVYACLNGIFACVGGTGAIFESCDCEDNDCDGLSDEPPEAGEPPLCSPGKDCVKTSETCQCAAPCAGGEYPCPAGQKCVVADANGTQGSYCVTDFDALCGDCSKKTVKNAQDQVECAPAGTDPAGCLETPVCLCKGQNGCREPCFNVACAAGKVCAKFGPNAGTCVDDSCYLTLCEGCDKDCHDGACINNPCKAGTCPPGEVCKPSADWSTAICVKSCQDVVCPGGTLCVDGDCKPTCDPACPEGQVCDEKANGGPTCVPTKCTQPCANGGYCDPLTGICGDDPCAGVVCPEGQACKDGSCGDPQGSNTSSSGSGATSGSGAGGGSSGNAGAVGSSAASGGGSKGVFGLPTGGGGVSCAVGHAPGSGSKRSFGWLALAAAAAVWSRRRRLQTEPGAKAPSRRRRRRVPGLTGRAKSLATLLVIAAVAGGCEDQPTCFENCDQAAASTAASGGGGSLSIVSSSSSAGGSIFSSSSVGGSDCVITNGGIEICDEIDNNCDGTVDEGIDFNKITHCGTCATNCFTSLLNADPKTIECDWNGMAGEPGSCSFGGCADDYFDLDQDGNSCEYYCVKTANDDSLCNNRDDDCDGDKDEDVNLCNSVDNCGACGRKCSVINGTGKCAPTGNPSTCDASNTQCAIDACDPGWFDLDKSFATGCEYSCTLSNGGVEICGDGIDNDCDGAIDGADSDLSGDPQVGILCYGDPDGLCGTPAHAGLTQCVGQKVICAGMNVLLENQVNETCNGIDDDCDGAVDDNPSDAGGSCGTTNVFPCAFGTKQCVSGKIECVGAINPKTEVCNGIDDDCDGGIDLQNGNPPSDAGASCNVPPMPPMNATSPCKAGTLVCLGGVLGCQGSVGPTAQVDSCGDDSNCDGLLDTQPDTNSDINNCGSCGNDCYAGSLHATWSCKSGVCNFEGCENGWYDFVGNDNQCETPCLPSGGEICDGIDNDCNGMTDDGLTPPSPVQVCGVSPAASRAECTSQVSVTCNNGGWQCNFPAGVCNPSCATPNQEVCDNLDNDCDGLFNENVSNYGLPCASDDGLNPGHGACRRTGTFVCDGGNATKCSATKGSCAQNPGGCAEACDGIDNDCDGDIDEPYTSKGSDSAYFVKPQVTKIGLSLWMMSFEASRPNAHGQSAGTGNGYHCSNCPAGIPNAPSNTPLDETLACSVQGRLPWFNVTPVEAEQSCDAIGGFLCPTTSWSAGCQASNTCDWAYSPRGAACLSKASNNKFCNLGSFDFDPSSSGDQDGLLATGSNQLKNCAADWSGLFQNTTPDIFDQTGNLREITKSGSNIYPLMGGSFSTASEDAATCTFDFYTVEQNFQLLDTGFRCCFDSDPRL